MSFVENAKKSAEIYYEYLKANNKGEITYKVESIAPSKYDGADGFFALKLQGPKVAQPDFLQIAIDDKVYDSASIEIATYIDKSNALIIKPGPSVYKKLKECNRNQIKVFTDLKFLVKRVENWYEEHGNKIEIPVISPIIQLDLRADNLKDASQNQIDAMKGVLSTPFSYVWGAPGTGKTQFVLARLVNAYVVEEKKVLITAPTNNAVEQTLRGVLPVLKEAGVEIEDAVLRLGVPSDRFAREFPEICESSRLARAIRKVQERIAAVKQEIAQNEKMLVQYSEYGEKLDFINDIEDYIFIIQENDKYITEKENELREGEAKQEKLSVDLEKAKNERSENELAIEKNKVKLSGLYLVRDKYKTGIRALFSKKKLEETELAIEQCLEEGAMLNQNLAKLVQDIGDLNQDIEKNTKLIEELTLKLRTELSKIKERSTGIKEIDSLIKQLSVSNYLEKSGELLSQLQLLIEEKKEETKQFSFAKTKDAIETDNSNLNAELNELQDQFKDISSDSDERLEKCQIIAATIDTSLARVTPNMPLQFDHIFLDEAGYSCAIKAATLLSFHSPVTFLGDHMQLPPVCEMDDDKFKEPEYESVSYWAQSALYIENAINDSVDDFVKQYLNAEEAPFYLLRKFSLTQTYRFGPKLASVLAEDVYNAGLVGNENHNTDIFFIDACKGPNDEKRTCSGEIYAIVEYCTSHCNEEIAVLTPYKKQVNMLREAFRREGLDSNCIFTIHGSQGREWDTVLFSVVDTYDMWFVDSFNKKARGKNLINTAVSRAKTRLILVADRKYWLNQEGQLIEKLISVASDARH